MQVTKAMINTTEGVRLQVSRTETARIYEWQIVEGANLKALNEPC